MRHETLHLDDKKTPRHQTQLAAVTKLGWLFDKAKSRFNASDISSSDGRDRLLLEPIWNKVTSWDLNMSQNGTHSRKPRVFPGC